MVAAMDERHTDAPSAEKRDVATSKPPEARTAYLDYASRDRIEGWAFDP
jgi:hypothetical protein